MRTFSHLLTPSHALSRPLPPSQARQIDDLNAEILELRQGLASADEAAAAAARRADGAARAELELRVQVLHLT